MGVVPSGGTSVAPASSACEGSQGGSFNPRKLVGLSRASRCSTAVSSPSLRVASTRAKFVPLDSTPFHSVHTKVSELILRPSFDWWICGLIILNAMLLGVQTDYLAREQVVDLPLFFQWAETGFCLLFTVELVLRLYVFRSNYFTMPGWHWNLFDFLVVMLQLVEEILTWAGTSALPQNISMARMIRIIRLVRIIRLARILRLIHELRVLVSCISNSLKSLVWTVLLLIIMIYSVALVITQLVSDYRIANEQKACGEGECCTEVSELERYYGNLLRSMLSLFEAISGGIDWDALVHPLMTGISPLLGVVFCIYIMFAVLAMMNVVTGVFVDSVLLSAKQDKDAFLLNNAREIFKTIEDGKISLPQFLSLMDNRHMKDFFRAIDVDPSEASNLFMLMDLDESGEIEAEEFLSGCVRLRGPSKALDTAVLVMEVRRILDKLHELEQEM